MSNISNNNLPKVVLATRNQHKIKEIRSILISILPEIEPSDLVGADAYDVSEPIEDGITFAENALIKARQLARDTGLIALADDSGLCVDVLGGAPGVFSARWSGKHGDDRANLEILVAQLSDVPQQYRKAEFRCAVAVVSPQGTEWVREGSIRGHLATKPSALRGFGYDPIIIAEGHSKTLAEISIEEKNQISHRAKALKDIAPILKNILCV